MWLEPKNYVDYEKLPSILKDIQEIFKNTSLDDLRKLGQVWPKGNAFSIFLINTSDYKDSPEEFREVVEKLSQLSGLHQTFINIIGPHESLPFHKDNEILGDIQGALHCYQIVLAIQIPSTDPEICGFKVGDEMRTYSSGAIVAFDGQVLHGGWNNSEDYRITVCIDIDKSLDFWT